ncbi:hypothetical protein X734_02535 [Mesorhizobium sp. L2C084A000]|jgi:hypothetical protein|nr:hypothetical protein X734_02535 [Mesorhizobium sp. L2C084A000]
MIKVKIDLVGPRKVGQTLMRRIFIADRHEGEA